MKEKIKTFLKNGGLLLITAIVNFIIMIFFAVDFSLEIGLKGGLIMVLTFLPWSLLCLVLYKAIQKEDRLLKICYRLVQFAEETTSELDRYIAIYGELPAEEESEKQNSKNTEKTE